MLSKMLARVTVGVYEEAHICAVYGRTIQDNLHNIRYIVEGLNESGKGEVVVHLDRIKAFDMDDHLYLVSMFAYSAWALAFSRRLCKYMKILNRLFV